ncbi:hypothetical protein CK203_032148 [Vitis vinifera]|uniref:Uncharacterized protein n=1 Tax=Vitis vinifera TaxID=29760 RepID=A0A438IPH5_VITVI|nr:hypothetical protein CK203_032148 [Vitis vinifera]
MDELLKNNVLAAHAIVGAGSVTLASLLTYPLDTLKTLVQVGSGSGKQLGTAQILDRVRILSGTSDFSCH